MKWFTKYIILKYKYNNLLKKYEFDKKLLEEENKDLFIRKCDVDYENMMLKNILKDYEENKE